MRIFNIALKVTLITSLLVNSAGWGYALRPAAFENSDIKIEDIFKKPPVMEVPIEYIDIIERTDDTVREMQWYTDRGPFIERYVSVRRFIRLGEHGHYLIKPYPSGQEAGELFFQACVQGYANIMPCWLLTEDEESYLKGAGVNIEEEKRHMLISASCNYHEGEASLHIIHTDPRKAYAWLLAANIVFAYLIIVQAILRQ